MLFALLVEFFRLARTDPRQFPGPILVIAANANPGAFVWAEDEFARQGAFARILGSDEGDGSILKTAVLGDLPTVRLKFIAQFQNRPEAGPARAKGASGIPHLAGFFQAMIKRSGEFWIHGLRAW